jgi:hypothetical protein
MQQSIRRRQFGQRLPNLLPYESRQVSYRPLPLSPDLMYNIIDKYVEAKDHFTLQSLSLTCRSLRPYCRQQLFKGIYVGSRSSTVPLPRETTKLSSGKLAVLMKESPDLTRCIQAIHVSYTEHLDVSDGSQRQLTREEETIVYTLKRYNI